MFDFAWSEIVLVGVVALIAIGPKDLPIAMKAVAKTVKKARGMAAEFQGHVDDMLRDADLHEVRDNINQLRSLNLKSQVEQAVDPDGALRRTFASNPLAPQPAPPQAVQAHAEHVIAPPAAPIAMPVMRPRGAAPAFIPPEAAPAPLPAAPAFVPPEQARPDDAATPT